MAFYNGYVTIPTNTYIAWKSATLGNGYNADGYYGCQCWDYVAEFWYNVGFGTGWPHTGPNSAAYECWTVSRTENAGDKFDLIYNVNEIKQGDILVFDAGSIDVYGHIAFADEDYNGTNTIRCLGQNQGGGTPDPSGGTTASLNNLNLGQFLGAFRYKEWHQPVPPTPDAHAKTHFKWVLYNRKLKQMRNQM